MESTAVIEKARQLRISLRTDGEYIYYRPEKAAPPEFVEMLRDHKPQLLQTLSEAAFEQPASTTMLQAINYWAADNLTRWKQIRSVINRGYFPKPYLIDGRDILVAWAAANVALVDANSKLHVLLGLRRRLTTQELVSMAGRRADIGFWGRLVVQLHTRTASAIALDSDMVCILQKLLNE